MNENDVLNQLRDIHLPADLGSAVPVAFAGWPFAMLAVVILAILAVRYWRRNRWRRNAKAEFARIVEVRDQDTQWSMLLAFAASLSDRARRPVALPNLAFRRPETVSETERMEFINYLGTELGR